MVQIIKTMVGCIAIIVSSYCNANITATEISIKCCEVSEEIPIHKYGGIPNTRLSLIAKGIRVAGISNLVTDLDITKAQQSIEATTMYIGGNINVIATCVPYVSGKQALNNFYTNVTNYMWNDMWPPGKTLVCEKGDGIEIAMFSPNDKNPDKYQYVATLIAVRDDENKEGKKEIIVNEANNNSSDFVRDEIYEKMNIHTQLSINKNNRNCIVQ